MAVVATFVYAAVSSYNNSINYQAASLAESLVNYKLFFGPVLIFALLPIMCFVESRELYLFNFNTLYYEELRNFHKRLRINLLQLLFSIIFIFAETLVIQIFYYMILISMQFNALNSLIALCILELIVIFSIIICLSLFWIAHKLIGKWILLSNLFLFLSFIFLFINQIMNWKSSTTELNNYDETKIQLNDETKINYIDLKNILSIENTELYKKEFSNTKDIYTLIHMLNYDLRPFNDNNKIIIKISKSNDTYAFRKFDYQELISYVSNKNLMSWNIAKNLIHEENEISYFNKLFSYLKEDQTIEKLLDFFKDDSLLDKDLVSTNLLDYISIDNDGIHLNIKITNDDELFLTELFKEIFLYCLYDSVTNDNDIAVNILDVMFTDNNYKKTKLNCLDQMLWSEPIYNNELIGILKKFNYSNENLNQFIDYFITSLIMNVNLKQINITLDMAIKILNYQNNQRMRNYFDITNHMFNLEISFVSQSKLNNYSFLHNNNLDNVSKEINSFNELEILETDDGYFITNNLTYSNTYTIWILVIYTLVTLTLFGLIIILREQRIRNFVFNYTSADLLNDIINQVYKKEEYSNEKTIKYIRNISIGSIINSSFGFLFNK
ncbi:hypothetical protein [Spiroplasma endosymbiont of Labia minor]|uniref:hypothetical protein n=1 Tax=Spiroplasma endosymbiont of Labia minor TaxID=3066305 RepID=UPI0030D38425